MSTLSHTPTQVALKLFLLLHVDGTTYLVSE